MRLLFAAFLLSACTPFPELAESISDSARTAPFPQLTPLPALPQAPPAEAEALLARADALRARAQRIREIDIAALQ